MRRVFRCLHLVLVLIGYSTVVRASDTLQVLRSNYQRKLFLLRGFYQDDSLLFDKDGELKRNARSGSWTTSFIYITDLHLKSDSVIIDGRRVAQVSPKDSHDFEPKGTGANLRIKVELDNPTLDAVRSALDKIFVGPQEHMADVVPAEWKDVMKHLEQGEQMAPPEIKTPSKSDCEQNATVEKPCKVGGTIKPPKILSAKDPNYDQWARAGKYQGTTVLEIVVDDTGHPQNIKIVRAVGFGLDDEAVQAVRKWTFSPATREGVPIPVMINVEVNFRLY